MFGMGMPEILLILAIALIVIGPKKLPDLAKSLGRAIGEFKRATNELKSSIDIDPGFQDVKNAFDNLNQDVTEELKGSLDDPGDVDPADVDPADDDPADDDPVDDDPADDDPADENPTDLDPEYVDLEDTDQADVDPADDDPADDDPVDENPADENPEDINGYPEPEIVTDEDTDPYPQSQEPKGPVDDQ